MKKTYIGIALSLVIAAPAAYADITYTNAELTKMAEELVRPATRDQRPIGLRIHGTMDVCKTAASGWASDYYATAEYVDSTDAYEIGRFGQARYGYTSCVPYDTTGCEQGEESCDNPVPMTKYWEERFESRYGEPKWTSDGEQEEEQVDAEPDETQGQEPDETQSQEPQEPEDEDDGDDTSEDGTPCTTCDPVDY